MSDPSVERRRRLLFGGRPTRWAVAVPVTFFLAGLLFGTSASTSRGYDLRGSIGDGLPEQVAARSRALEGRQQQVSDLDAEVKALGARSTSGGGEAEALEKKVAALTEPAGLAPVRGPVLEVSLNDSQRPLSSFAGEYTADDLVIHQQDVQAFVNAMWRGGAEAMMIQDQRVVSTSAVRCVGNTLILQGRVYSPPFTIRAIGDVAAMRAAIDADETVQIFKQYVEAVGLRYDIADKGEQRFPAFDGSVALRNARVVRPAGHTATSAPSPATSTAPSTQGA